MKYLTLFAFSVSVSCVHKPAQDNFETRLSSLRCEEAFQAVPELEPSKRAADSAEWLAKNSLAYTYVGLNYSAEVLWDVSVGTVGFIALCGPMMLAGGMNRVDVGIGHYQTVSPGCIPAPNGAKNLFSPALGKKALKSTKEFRCPNVEPLSLSIEKIASCYEIRAQTGDLQKALTTLKNVEDSKHFYSCTKPETQARITAHRQQLEIQTGAVQ